MSRDALKPLFKLRKTFEGTFVRYGKKSFKNHVSTTVLLSDVKLKGEARVLTDHIWLNYTKGIREHMLKEGDVVVFEARVIGYTKGYRGHRDDVESFVEYDYKLSHPTNIRLRANINEDGKWF